MKPATAVLSRAVPQKAGPASTMATPALCPVRRAAAGFGGQRGPARAHATLLGHGVAPGV